MDYTNNSWETERIKNGLPPWTSISFACGGWLQFYLYGVARAIQARKLDDPYVKYCGCSAGALTCTGLVTRGNFDIAVQFCKTECVPRAYSEWKGLINLSEYVGKCIDLAVKPAFDSSEIHPGSLHITLTKLPFFTQERVSEFENFEDLKNCLLASTAAFPFASIVRRKGFFFIDGGLSDFQPIIDEHTVTVSPLYFSDADIKPSRYVPPWWSFLPPSSDETIDWLYCLGWEDAHEYFNSRGIPEVGDSIVTSMTKSPHPYDRKKKITMFRFLGYDVKNISGEWISFILDFLLLGLFVLILKPASLLVIYSELFCRLMFLSFSTFINIFKNKSRKSYYEPNMKRESSRSQLDTEFSTLFDYMLCFFSLSLLLRFLTIRPSHQLLKKHNRLLKLSFFYRLFRHFL